MNAQLGDAVKEKAAGVEVPSVTGRLKRGEEEGFPASHKTAGAWR